MFAPHVPSHSDFFTHLLSRTHVKKSSYGLMTDLGLYISLV